MKLVAGANREQINVVLVDRLRADLQADVSVESVGACVDAKVADVNGAIRVLKLEAAPLMKDDVISAFVSPRDGKVGNEVAGAIYCRLGRTEPALMGSTWFSSS